MQELFRELKRRNVVRVGVAYLALGWLVVQITALAVPALNLPASLISIVFYLGIIGFPFALLFAWAFELTPDGIKRSKNVDIKVSDTSALAHRLEHFIVIVLVLAVVALSWDFSDQGSDENAEQANEVEQPLSIAVLPFINMSAVADNVYFARGLHEETLTKLSYIKGLKVTSRTSSEKYIDSKMSMVELGQELQVRYILEGSVRRVNNFVRITVQLIDTASDSHLWASNYDHELIDVFSLQSVVAKEISNSVQLTINPDFNKTIANNMSQNARAYDLFQKAKSIDRSVRESEESLTQVRLLLEEAVSLDPNFVEAWGFLNEICDHIIRNIHLNAWFAGEQRQSVLHSLTIKAKNALTKAIELDPNNLETLLAMASDSVTERNDPTFHAIRKKSIDKALALYPDDAMAWYVLAWWYELGGNIEDSDPAFRKANELDPLNARIILGSILHYTNVQNQEMSSKLTDRFMKSIAGISETDKYGILFQSLFFSGNTQLITDFIEDVGSDFWHTVHALDIAMAIFQVDVAELIKREPLFRLTQQSGPDESYRYLIMQRILLQHYLRNAQTDKVAEIARRIVTIREVVDWDVYFEAHLDEAFAEAYLAIDEQEQALSYVNKLLTGREHGDYNINGTNGFGALANVDIDQAVELILTKKRENKRWLGPYYYALNCWLYQELIEHPKMRAFYEEDGQWMSYLSERIPSYQN